MKVETMTPAERDKKRDEICYGIAMPILRDMLSRTKAHDMCLKAFDSAVQLMQEAHNNRCARLAVECAALREENESLRQTEKVYHMNREWIADAKVEIATLKAEVEKLKGEK